MNYANLDRLIWTLRLTPSKTFNMSRWGHDKDGKPLNARALSTALKNRNCGTSACIAGFVRALRSDMGLGTLDTPDAYVWETADFLGITLDAAKELCTGRGMMHRASRADAIRTLRRLRADAVVQWGIREDYGPLVPALPPVRMFFWRLTPHFLRPRDPHRACIHSPDSSEKSTRT